MDIIEIIKRHIESNDRLAKEFREEGNIELSLMLRLRASALRMVLKEAEGG